MLRSGANMSMLTGLVTGTALALAYLFVAARGSAGGISPGGVVLVIGAFTSVSGTLANISSTFVAGGPDTTVLGGFFSFLPLPPAFARPPAPPAAPPPPTRANEFRER